MSGSGWERFVVTPAAVVKYLGTGALAQLVEHLLCKQKVRSSILLCSTTKHTVQGLSGNAPSKALIVSFHTCIGERSAFSQFIPEFRIVSLVWCRRTGRKTPMAAKKIRKARVFAIHGHVKPRDEGGVNLPYDVFFDTLRKYFSEHRLQTRDEVIAVVSVREYHGFIAFRFVRATDESLTIFDERTGDAHEAELPKGQKSASSTWFIYRPGSRLVFIESKRPGVPVSKIERFLVDFGRRKLHYSELTIDLDPVASSDFEHEIDRFDRIREVRVQMARPNHSWPIDNLIPAAVDSNAESLELTAKAARNKSLKKNGGIVKKIKTLAKNPISGLKNVFVYGNAPGTAGEKRITLQDSQLDISMRGSTADTEEDVVTGLIEKAKESDFPEATEEKSE